MDEHRFRIEFALDEAANFHLAAIADFAFDDRIFLYDRFACHSLCPSIDQQISRRTIGGGVRTPQSKSGFMSKWPP